METNLLSFVANMKRELDAFQDNWLNKHEINPQTYPMDLESTGEWLEQYFAWLNSN